MQAASTSQAQPQAQGSEESVVQMNQYRSFVSSLIDPTSKDSTKWKAVREISINFETILSSSLYQSFLDHSVKIFLKVLQEGEPHFIAEYNIQQVRKSILEILHRLPTNDSLKPYVKPILSLTFKLLEIDNEENVLICLKIIIELHKQYRPTFNKEIQDFLQFVKSIYTELPGHMNKIFEPRQPIQVKDLSKLPMPMNELLKETFTMTRIQTEVIRDPKAMTYYVYNLIPKAVLSLKVIQELPIIVVLMYQLYRENVDQDVSGFIPLIMNTIVLQPSPQQRMLKTFNKEIYVDFMGAQIKSLSFLAYIIKLYQQVVSCHSDKLVQGMLGLLTLCPMEVAHLRRELLIASRHILATELRNKFVPQMERLFDEEVLLGRGWTTHESLRPLAYSTLADLVHHVRQQLTLADIGRAVHLFSKNVHDDTLATTIQTMSCKLLLNLVECIKKRVEIEKSTKGRALLMRMLEVFVLKFKTIAKIQLPRMREKNALAIKEAQSQLAIKPEDATQEAPAVNPKEKEERSRLGFPPQPNYNVAEYRSLVKTLVCGVKTITWGVASCKPSLKQFQPHETLVFIRLVKWALQALDIYTLNVGQSQSGAARSAQQNLRNKEEKEVLEHFSSVFSMMHSQTFHEIFSTTIDYVVERVFKNSSLQIVPNTLLANPTTSPIFATVLVEYLLERMEEMGSNQECSSLYLKLFKLVFGSVSLFPQENEKMLRPHLHQIVNRSMELAMSAKDPHNYFLLLRALFRSIGGGSHDLLYQEFLPLLPNLLEGLNRLQSGLHKQHMKDLFVELCLTVPVRLSSLLPYLPMLMDPLVSALNGSHLLISQGLRTLELCVDNLQHDFLYEHIQPVRAELMQALWRTLRNHDHVHVAMVAFKVLGKFGGGNRKMMIEPQRLDYVASEYDPPAILATFPEHAQALEFPVQHVIETAFTALKQSNTDSFYRKQAWEVISTYLTASLNLQDDMKTLLNLFMHPSYQDEAKIQQIKGASYRSVYKQARDTHRTALVGMFFAVAIKELYGTVFSTMEHIVRHYTMVAVAQQSGAFAITPRPNEQVALDPLVLIDALAVIIGHEERELIKPGKIALLTIIETATILLGSTELACRLPIVEYIAERMCSLCYERAWYAKLGGCHAIAFLIDRCAKKWVYEHMFTFLKALLFVMMDLTGEVSSGALDQAKINLEKMITFLVTPLEGEQTVGMREAQHEALPKVTEELMRQVTSPHTMVREQSMASLRLLADKQGKSVRDVMEPFSKVLEKLMPPNKHLLKHQPAIAQMGLMDGNMFCTTLKPRLFSIDMSTEVHKLFIEDLISLCETEDAKLVNLFCYKNISNFNPLRMSALRVLAACHYLEGNTLLKIFHVLYNTLEKPNAELQQTAFECMKAFTAGYQVEMATVRETMRPLLSTLKNVKTMSLDNVKMFSFLAQLFPKALNQEICNELINLLEEMLASLQAQSKAAVDVTKKSEEEQKVVTILTFFHQSQRATSAYIERLCHLVLQTEQNILIEASSPFREPLMKFLLRYPIESVTLFMADGQIKRPQYSRYLEYLVKHTDGRPFRDYIQSHMVDRLIALALGNSSFPLEERNEMQYQAIRLVYLLSRRDKKVEEKVVPREPEPVEWLNDPMRLHLVDALKTIWCTDAYQQRHKAVDTLEYTHWREPKMLVKILLNYFRDHPTNIMLLFQLLRALCDRFIPEFQFLKDFLQETVAHRYEVEWKRDAFFLFVEHFEKPTMSQELKAKVLQLIIIPCFAVSFERGETDLLIGTPPAPSDNIDNIVSVCTSKLLIEDTDEAPFRLADCLRIALYQLLCLLVEQASPHIHNGVNKKEGDKMRMLMTFAWPCLLGKNCVDATARYHGHLLLSHLIDKFAVHDKIVAQVFYSLLKAHGLEARNVVRQALDILTPWVPIRAKEKHKLLVHWTKKIIVDEGHSMQQLFHILQLVVKHCKVYYPVRNDLVRYIVNSIQRLGFNPTGTFEHRKLAVELSEVVINWELQALREAMVGEMMEMSVGVKKALPEDNEPNKRLAFGEGSTPIAVKAEPGASKSMEHVHTDTVLNFLLRLACHVNDQTQQTPAIPTGSTPGELLSQRCVNMLKITLKSKVWTHQIDLKLVCFDKYLQTVDQPTANVASICTSLELLTFLLTVMRKEQILSNFKLLQRGIAGCLTSSNNKIIRLVHTLLHKLMEMFPTERTNANMSSKHEELEVLYTTVAKVITDGLNNFDKNAQATTSSLYGTIMILKAACMKNFSYIDLLITSFMKVLLRIAKEHLQPTNTDTSLITSELLILSLDLVKTRVVVMSNDMRKTFIGSILVNLIEKTQDLKVMKAIVKMLEEWIKNKDVVTLCQAPNLREKSILLVKLMQYVEKRFPDDNDLNAQFLELINYIYVDEKLKQTELSAKLEPAFLSGLRCSQPHIRAKFFKVFDESMQRRLHDRLLYITSSQNWDAIGQHYWIKQCIELLLVTASPDVKIQMSHESSILPNITAVINGADAVKREEFYANAQPTLDSILHTVIKEEVVEMETDVPAVAPADEKSLTGLIRKHYEFIEASRNTTSLKFLVAAAQLCHMDTHLAEQVWLAMFPKFWTILDEQQRLEIQPFITSGAHIIQRDCHLSAINTFVESVSRCQPPLQLHPPLIKYLAKTHNLWHRMALTLEQMAMDPAPARNCYDFEPDANPKNEIYDNLGELYSLLCEEDMWAGLWQRHAHYKETNIAIAYEQHGFFEQAQTAYENAMLKYKQDASMGPTYAQREVMLWSQHWIRAARELKQWDVLLGYAKSGVIDPYLILESSWRSLNWDTAKESLAQLEHACSKELQWKVTLYNGYLWVCNPEDKQQLKNAERYVELASQLCLQEWRRLPHIVSHIHLPYLQAAQQIMELQEAFQIRKGLQQGHQNSLHDMKAIVKTWRNRLPVIADDLSHWNDIFNWRQHHYEYIIKHYEKEKTPPHQNLMLGVHASAQSFIHFGKIARKQKLPNLCLESLNRIYAIPSVPVIDCFQKIRQQIKCYLQQSTASNKDEYQVALDVLNKANPKYFTNDMNADFYALKGLFYHLSGKSDEANNAFSAGLQMNDLSIKAWALYGDYLEAVFTGDPRQISYGVNAISCFLHACRHQNESKPRKYLAKVLWLLSYDDADGALMKALEKYSVGVPPLLWVPWTPQLLNWLLRHDGNVILNLLLQVGKMFPQAVYFPIRSLYLTLRSATARNALAQGQGDASQQPQANETSTIEATQQMKRCSHIMNIQCNIHTTVLGSLEYIADQMDWFIESWYEEVARQLRQGLNKCYAMAFETRENVNEAKVTPHIVSFIRTIASTFGTGIDEKDRIPTSTKTVWHSTASESLARRAEAAYKDPVWHKMKAEFTKFTDLKETSTLRLRTMIYKLKQWIKVLENRSKMFNQSFLIEDKSRYLSSFTLKTADVELPGEFLLPKHTHYYVRIARFMPRVDIVQKHNMAAHRLYIRGHNGKIYPYLVISDSGLTDGRREERVLQLLRMMNHYLGKQKETARRFLHYTVPRVVTVGQKMRLVEDNVASISLLDIYKKGCAKILKIEHDAPMNLFYEKLANVQSRGVKASIQVYKEILKNVQTNMVPRTLLKQWALTTFPSATDYWQFRKMFTLQLALACFAEYVLHLTRLNPDMMYLHQDSGLMNVAYFKFDVDDAGELDTTRPVSFRLTPNIVEFISGIGVSGPLTASMISAARCFAYANFKVTAILKPILKDEMLLSRVKKPEDADATAADDKDKLSENEKVIVMVNKAVSAISGRLTSLAHFDGVDSKVSELVVEASCHDNLCRMDPSWHPWL